jgi:hypothetical protein
MESSQNHESESGQQGYFLEGFHPEMIPHYDDHGNIVAGYFFRKTWYHDAYDVDIVRPGHHPVKSEYHDDFDLIINPGYQPPTVPLDPEEEEFKIWFEEELTPEDSPVKEDNMISETNVKYFDYNMKLLTNLINHDVRNQKLPPDVYVYVHELSATQIINILSRSQTRRHKQTYEEQVGRVSLLISMREYV